MSLSKRFKPPQYYLCVFQKCHIGLLGLVNICFAGYFPWSMHAENRYTGINHFHTVQRHDVGDGSAASDINFTKLCCLPIYFCIIKDSAKSSDVLCIGIV